MAKVAFLGLGTMGREMALRLLKAGHAVTGWNRTPAKAAALAATGARVAESPAAAVADAEMIVAMVGDDDASRAVWLGPGGVLEGRPRPGALAVESSTLSRAWVVELAAAVGRAGLRYLDCPVTGGPDGAAAGRLTLLAGGAEADLAAAWPVLAAYAGRAIRFGPVGAGTAYKVIVNLMGAAQAAALAEGFLVAEKAGLPLDKVAEALASGACASPMVKYMVERLRTANHDDVYFTARWRWKDAGYGLKLAAEVGQEMPVSAAATAAFARAVAKGWGEKNSSIVIEAIRGQGEAVG